MHRGRTRSPTATVSHRILTAAGFRDIAIDPMEGKLVLGGTASVDAAVAFATHTGALRGLLGPADDLTRANGHGGRARGRRAVRRR